MTGNAGAALLCMGNAITEPMAAHWARLAYERGASREAIDLAWHLWRVERAREVQTVPSAARCRCSHGAHTGPCRVRACGCAIFRPKEGVA